MAPAQAILRAALGTTSLLGARPRRSRTLVPRLPHHLLQQSLAFAILVVVLLWPDLWIILEGDQGSLDSVMLVAMCLLAVDVLVRVFVDRGYNHRSLFADLVVLFSILLDVSWAFGLPHDDLAVRRKSVNSVWRIIGVYIKFGACAVRLTLFIRSITGLLQSGYERRLKHRSNHVEPEGSSRMFEFISRKLAQAILLHLVTFTILIILSVQVVDVFTPPLEDASVQAWVQVLSLYARGNGSSADGMESLALEKELQRFREFYSNMAYGPYSICLGAAEAPEGTAETQSFPCRETLWQGLAGTDFVDPQRQSFRLDVNSSSVQASFNFEQPAKHEALIRMMIVSTTVLFSVIVALSLDSVASGLVVSPLARLLPMVRQVMTQLHEKFPALGQLNDGEEYDEATAFEEMVSKLTLIVTTATKHKHESAEPEAGSEQIGRPVNERAIEISATMFESQTSGGEEPVSNIRRLLKLGVPHESIDSWSFDVLSLEKPQLTGVAGWLLLECANPYLSVEPQVVTNFLDALVQEYRDENPYHNWRHACDVLHGVFRGSMLSRVLEFAPRVDGFALLVAAVGHDVGHPGWNNQFLVQTQHELALRYNDLSPLENMHCSTMFGILSSRPDANVFSVLSREQYREARRVCIETILQTDNAKHFEMVKELQMFYHANSDVFDLPRGATFPTIPQLDLLQQVNNRRVALAALLHGADISNPCKPWKICESWADLVLREFFLQGDKEKRLGIPVQMLNNRETVNKPSSQVAFIEFFIYPFNVALVKVFPPLWEMSDNLCLNLQQWQALRSAEEQETTGQKVQTIVGELLVLAEGAWQQTKRPSRRPSATRQFERTGSKGRSAALMRSLRGL